MISGWTIYWITRLDSIVDLMNKISVFLMISLGILFVLVLLLASIGMSEASKDALKSSQCLFKHLIITLLIVCPVFIIRTFIPSSKDVAAIVIIPLIINNEKIQQIPNEVMDLGLEWLKDLKPTKEDIKEIVK